MNNQTAAELIEGVGQTAVALAKEWAVRRQERRQMEREAEMQREMIELESGESTTDEGDAEPDTVESVLDRAVETSAEYESLLEEAEAKEECQLCRTLISQAREKPLSQQRKLLPELREFVSKVDNDASKEELVSAINQNEALKGLLQEHMASVQEATSPSTEGSGGSDTESRRRTLSRSRGS